MSGADRGLDGTVPRWFGRVVAILWALWWLVYGFLTPWSTGYGLGWSLAYAAFPGVLFLTLAWLPWRWEAWGAALLTLEGAMVLVGYPLASWDEMTRAGLTFVALTMGLPPLVAGLALALAWQQDRRGDREDRRGNGDGRPRGDRPERRR